MSLTNLGQYSYLQATLLVLVIYCVGELFHNGRGPILLFNIYIIYIYSHFVFLHYNVDVGIL